MELTPILYKSLRLCIVIDLIRISKTFNYDSGKDEAGVPSHQWITEENVNTDTGQKGERRSTRLVVGPIGPTVALALDGSDGADGQPGRDGENGQPGRDGENGQPGRDGDDGDSRQTTRNPGLKGQPCVNVRCEGTQERTNEKSGNNSYLIVIIAVFGAILVLTDAVIVVIIMYLRKVMKTLETRECDKRYDDLGHTNNNARYETYREMESTHLYQEPHNYIDIIGDST